MFKSVLALMIVGLFATSAMARDDEYAVEQALRFKSAFKKLTVAAEQTQFNYFGVFMKRMEESVDKFRDVIVEHPEPNDEGVAAFLDVYNGMLKDIVSDLKVLVSEKTRMTSDEFDRWLGSWKSIKSVVTTCLLAFTEDSMKSFAKLAFVVVELFVMTIVSLVEDVQTITSPLATVESFILVIAELVMG